MQHRDPDEEHGVHRIVVTLNIPPLAGNRHGDSIAGSRVFRVGNRDALTLQSQDNGCHRG